MQKKVTATAAVRLVRKLAKKKGTSVKDVLSRANVSYSTFWRWRKHESAPSSRTLMVIEAANAE